MPGKLLIPAAFDVLNEVAGTYYREVLDTPLPVLRDLFEDLNVDPPEKIFLIAKEKREPVSSTSESIDLKPSAIAKTSTNDDLNLTGSPLKCPFSLKEEDDSDLFTNDSVYSRKSSEGPNYFPIIMAQAKKCIAEYNVRTDNKKSAFPGCWIVCDPEEGHLFYGARRLLDCLSLYKVSWSGPHDCKSSHLKLGNFLNNYHNLVAPSGSNVKQILTAKSVYNLSVMLDDLGCERGENSLVRINFCWTKPKEMLERPPILAEAEVHFEIYPGDEKMSTHRMFMELKTLQGFASGLSNQGITWRGPQSEKKTFREEVEVFLQLIQEVGLRNSSHSQKANEAAINNSHDEDPLSFEIRNDLDFTDHLWNCLMIANSYSQMSTTIAGILKIIHSQELRPFIYPKNDTKIARIVQEIVRGREEPPSLEGKAPLEILVEIGIEKLMRDYVHAFLSCNLASREQLLPFLTSNHLADSDLSVSNLFKLHLVYEIVCLSKMYLSADQECLRSMVQSALQQLRNYDLYLPNNRHSFVFPISSSFVTDKVSKSSPSVWQCTATSKSPQLEVTTTANLSLEPLSDLIPVKIEACDDTLDRVDVSYYATFASTIKRSQFKE